MGVVLDDGVLGRGRMSSTCSGVYVGMGSGTTKEGGSGDRCVVECQMDVESIVARPVPKTISYTSQLHVSFHHDHACMW